MKRWVVHEASTLLAVVSDREAIADGRVFVNRKRVQNASAAVRPGDVVTLAAAKDRAPVEIAVLARAGDLVAVAKPAGISTIPDHAGASSSLLALAAKTLSLPESRLHPTSRLDRDVSGVVVFSLHEEAARRLLRAREEGAYRRRYVAIASRAPEPASGEWDAPIGRASDPRLRKANGKDAVPAVTHYETIAAVAAGGQALLAVSPKTGRTHQIRVHASHAGVPLLGDRAYGGPPRLTLPTGRVLALGRVALHCGRVEVPGLEAVAPLPAELLEVWRLLGGEERAFEDAMHR